MLTVMRTYISSLMQRNKRKSKTVAKVDHEEDAILKRLHLRLTAVCTATAGLILLVLTFVCLCISQSGIRSQEYASFLTELDNLYQNLQQQTSLSHSWIRQMECSYQCSIRIIDNGNALFFQSLEQDAATDVLMEQAKEEALGLGFDLDQASSTSTLTRHLEFTMEVNGTDSSDTISSDTATNNGAANETVSSETAMNESASGKTASSETASESSFLSRLFASVQHQTVYVSVAFVPRSGGVLAVIVIHSLSSMHGRMVRQSLLFLGADLAAWAILAIFFWHFIARVLRPVQENRRKQVQFIASASHELRSPLTVILSNCAAVRSGVLPYSAQFLDIVDAEGNRMSHLITDMLQLAAADNETWSFAPTEIEPDTLLLQTWEDYEPQARAHGLKWNITLPDEPLPHCVCDADRIRQLLGILIDNAFSYTSAGGSVSLNAEQCDEHFGTLPKASSPVRSVLCIRVIDNGPGIPDSEKEAVFERFHRLDPSRKEKSHFGLGLCIAREIVRLHHGSLTITDTPGGGTTFLVKIPL